MNEKQKTNAVPESLEPPAMPKPFDPNDYPREFETVYPGIYLDREKPLMEEYFAEAANGSGDSAFWSWAATNFWPHHLPDRRAGGGDGIPQFPGAGGGDFEDCPAL